MAVAYNRSKGIITMDATGDTIAGPFYVESVSFSATASAGMATITDKETGAVLLKLSATGVLRDKQVMIDRIVSGLTLTLDTVTGIAIIYLKMGGI